MSPRVGRTPPAPRNPSINQLEPYAEYHRLQDQAVERAEPYPSHRFHGRGIVTCAGGPRLFTCAWVLIRMLRDVLQTALPIQVWHRGAAEMDTSMRALLEKHGVEVLDACAIESHLPTPTGFGLKPFSIIHSRFQEVLFLDADNLPIVDPAPLFETAAYRETGALFWPDLIPLPADSPVWSICRVPYRDEPSFESGQIVLDKAACWKPLLLTMHLNENSGFYYRYLQGDKDTFHMAWRFLGRPYGMVPYAPQEILSANDPLSYTSLVLGQRDFEGRVILQHRNGPKFILFGKNAHYPECRYESECLGFLDDLARVWGGRVSGLDLRPPEDHATRSNASRWFRLVRASNDEKMIELLPDQRIGWGGSRTERRWRMIPEGANSVLEIIGDEYVMYRLVRHEDGVWRGRLLRFERMPVELIPWQP